MSKGPKIALGVVLILMSLFTAGKIGFSSAEEIGYSAVSILLIVGGIYLIFRGIKEGKRRGTTSV